MTSPHYKWPEECENRFGTHPVQICHEWNTVGHLVDYEGDPDRRPLNRTELQQLLDYADDRVELAVKRGRKGALTAYRDATVLKVAYGWGLRAREVEEQLHRFLADIDDEEDRKLLRNYATWRLLHKLRTKARRPLTRPQATYALLKLSIAADLLEYLRRHGRQLEEADQHDLDRWQMSNTQAHRARDFLQWATARRHFRRGLLLAPRPRRHGSASMTDDERWKHARRLLHDTSIDRCDRFAGLLLLLFAQPSRRIVTLRTDAITQRIDNRAVSLALGTEPVVLPTLIGQLALDLVVNRYRGRAALAQTSDHD